VPVEYITISNTFTLTHKLNLKDPLLSNSLTLASSKEIAPVEKGLDGDAVLIMSD
jgi:hypothetical protein